MTPSGQKEKKNENSFNKSCFLLAYFYHKDQSIMTVILLIIAVRSLLGSTDEFVNIIGTD